MNTPEPNSPPSASPELWTVYRQDDNGNVFVVQDNVSQEEAERLVAVFEARSHKQLYTAQPKQAAQ
jgi:hypothetical protein